MRALALPRLPPRRLTGHPPTLADFWKRKYQQEDKRARALEDSLRALAVEQNDLQKQGAPSAPDG